MTHQREDRRLLLWGVSADCLLTRFALLLAVAVVIIAYSWNVEKSIEKRFEKPFDGDKSMDFGGLVPLYLGSGYFFLREVIQIISLLSLKAFKLWLIDASNYLNVIFVIVVLIWTVSMQTGKFDKDSFRVGAAVSVTILWYKLIAYLRNILLDFAVFVRGVIYVVRRLLAFLVSLGIILFAFAQMFSTVFQQSEGKYRCFLSSTLETPSHFFCIICVDRSVCNNFIQKELDRTVVLEQTRCDASEMEPYCNFWNSLLSGTWLRCVGLWRGIGVLSVYSLNILFPIFSC